MKQMDAQKTKTVDDCEPEVEVHFTQTELEAAQIGEIIEPVGDLYPEEVDECDPELGD